MTDQCETGRIVWRPSHHDCKPPSKWHEVVGTVVGTVWLCDCGMAWRWGADPRVFGYSPHGWQPLTRRQSRKWRRRADTEAAG